MKFKKYGDQNYQVETFGNTSTLVFKIGSNKITLEEKLVQKARKILEISVYLNVPQFFLNQGIFNCDFSNISQFFGGLGMVSILTLVAR